MSVRSFDSRSNRSRRNRSRPRPSPAEDRSALKLDSAELRAIHDALELLIAEYSSNPQRHHAASAARRTLAKVEAQLERAAEVLAPKKNLDDVIR